MFGWIERYKSEKVLKFWTDDFKYEVWKDIEVAVLEGWAKLKKAPPEAPYMLKKIKVSPQRVRELERETRHEVTAFVKALQEQLPAKVRPYVHMGITSSDIIDTAYSYQFKLSLITIRESLKGVLDVLAKLAEKYKDLTVVGRTHGVHAEPTTLGLRFLSFYAELRRNFARIEQAIDEVSYGKIAGAVGTYSTVPPEIESYVLDKFGLKPEPVATQIIPRDRYAFAFLVLSLLASSVERIALNIRLSQMTEIGELEEPFGEGQTGSSIMPHKKNPILAENLTGLSRVIRSACTVALENIPLFFERDISHSSAERIITPQVCMLSDFALNRLKILLEGLNVKKDKISENLKLSKGTILSSHALTILLEEGYDRDTAYKAIQRASFKAFENGSGNFLDYLKKELEKFMEPEKAREIIDRISKMHSSRTELIFKRTLNAGVKVEVKKYPDILDPEGKAIKDILQKLGYDVEDVRVGKIFEIKTKNIDDVKPIAEDILTNPLVETFRIITET